MRGQLLRQPRPQLQELVAEPELKEILTSNTDRFRAGLRIINRIEQYNGEPITP